MWYKSAFFLFLGSVILVGLIYKLNLARENHIVNLSPDFAVADPEVAAPAVFAPEALDPDMLLTVAMQHPSLLTSSLFGLAIAVVVAAALVTPLLIW